MGVEPTRVVSSELFSRQWPPPIGLSFRLFFLAENKGFEPSPQHMSRTRLAGERSEPTSAYSPFYNE